MERARDCLFVQCSDTLRGRVLAQIVRGCTIVMEEVQVPGRRDLIRKEVGRGEESFSRKRNSMGKAKR